VKYFFDTSLLVAAISVDHVHHATSQAVYLSAAKNHSSCAAHSLAELYATLTRLPGKRRMSDEQALLCVEETRTRLTTVTLEESEYCSVINDSAREGIIGGTIYDALIAFFFNDTATTEIYTWNLAHFRRLGGEIAKRVQTP